MASKLYNLVDIFGINIGLRYLNEEQYKTKFGAFATILITAFIVIQIIYVGSELVLKEKPDVIFSERYVAQPARYDFKPKTYNFAFGAQYPGNYTHFIDPSIYTISIEQSIMKKVFNVETGSYEQVWSSINVGYHPCTPEDFQVQSSHEYFTKLPGVENMYCLDLENNDLFIEGNFDQDSYGTLKIKFMLCDEKTSTVKCRDDIQEALTNSFVALYFNDLVVNPKDYDPFKTIGRDAFWNASPLFPKDATMYYRNIYVESDKGILFEDKNFERSTAVSYQDQEIIFGENSYYFTIHMRFEKSKETVYHRKYKKIDSLLAEIGGVAKALMIIGILMFQPINKLNLHQNLANSLFTFHREEQKHQENTNQQKGKLTDLIEDHRKKTFLRSTHLITTNRKTVDENREDIFQQDMNLSNIKSENFQKKPQTSHFNLNINNQAKVQFSTYLDREDSHREKYTDVLNTPHPILSNEPSTQPYFNTSKKINQNGIKNSVNLLEIIKQRNRMAESTKVQGQNQFTEQEQAKQDVNQNNHKSKGMTRSSILKGSAKNVFKQEKQSEQLDLKWSDYVKYYIWPFGRFQKKQQQIDYSIETIYQHLDILYIVKKLLELEKLKQLLLNEDQIKLIQFFPKPYIDVEQIENDRKSKKKTKNKSNEVNLLNNINDKSEKEKAIEAFKALQNIISKPYLTDIDKKVIEMLDGSILENIENNEDYLKELQESIEIEDNQFKETHINQLDQPIQTAERNLTIYQENPILEISGTQSINEQRQQKNAKIIVQNYDQINQKSQNFCQLEGIQLQEIQSKFEINEIQNLKSEQNLKQDVIENNIITQGKYNQQTIQAQQQPIIAVNKINLENKSLKEQINEQNCNQELIKFEDNQSIYSD